MLVTLVSWLVALAAAYLAVGLVFAVAFVTRGAGRVDPVAAHGTWGFRLAILPGCAALWPLLARRWARGERAPVERTPHRDAAGPAGGTP